MSVGSGLLGGNFFGTNVKLEQFNGSGNYDGFDRFGRPLKQQWKQGSTDIDHFTRSYDHASNLIQRDNVLHANHNRTYGYDDLFRMQSSDESDNSQDRFWGLDQLGNQRSIFHNNDGSGAANSTRTYSAANELETLSNGANPDPHDEAGNMTKMPSPSALNLGLTAKYDAWNRLVDLSNVNASFQYDGLHRRIKRTEGSATVHYYYNENWQVLTETDSAGSATAIYSYHPNYVDSVAVRMRPNNEHFFTHDHQFNVTAAIDRATGNVVERYHYSAHGEVSFLDPATFAVKNVTSSDIDVEYLFTGRRRDPASQLQLHRYRFYNAHLGQWINRDPAGYVDRMNLYGAYFTPGAVDPWGLQESGLSDSDLESINIIDAALRDVMNSHGHLLERLEEGNCPIPTFQYDPGEEFGTGNFVSATNMIFVGLNKVGMEGDLTQEARDALIHELIHAVDSCENGDTEKENPCQFVMYCVS